MLEIEHSVFEDNDPDGRRKKFNVDRLYDEGAVNRMIWKYVGPLALPLGDTGCSALFMKGELAWGKLAVLPKRWDVLDANDEACKFRINIDVLNEAFGVGRSMFPKACYPDRKGRRFLW